VMRWVKRFRSFPFGGGGGRKPGADSGKGRFFGVRLMGPHCLSDAVGRGADGGCKKKRSSKEGKEKSLFSMPGLNQKKENFP